MTDLATSEIRLPNNWEAVDVIGQGSFGIVYRAKRTIGQHTEWAAVKHISMPRSQAELKTICYELETRDERTVNEYLNNSLQDMLGEYFQMKALLGHPNKDIDSWQIVRLSVRQKQIRRMMLSHEYVNGSSTN